MYNTNNEVHYSRSINACVVWHQARKPAVCGTSDLLKFLTSRPSPQPQIILRITWLESQHFTGFLHRLLMSRYDYIIILLGVTAVISALAMETPFRSNSQSSLGNYHHRIEKISGLNLIGRAHVFKKKCSKHFVVPQDVLYVVCFEILLVKMLCRCILTYILILK